MRIGRQAAGLLVCFVLGCGSTQILRSCTHLFTAKDKAVGLAYPIASRIARQIAAALGDANDPYGGLGRNGAQKTPGARVVTLAAPGSAYGFAARGIYNLDSNAIIGGHSDLAHPEVAYALISAIAT